MTKRELLLEFKKQNNCPPLHENGWLPEECYDCAICYDTIYCAINAWLKEDEEAEEERN